MEEPPAELPDNLLDPNSLAEESMAHAAGIGEVRPIVTSQDHKIAGEKVGKSIPQDIELLDSEVEIPNASPEDEKSNEKPTS